MIKRNEMCYYIYKSRVFHKTSACLSRGSYYGHSCFLRVFLMPRSCDIHSRFGRLLLLILLPGAQVWSKQHLVLHWDPVLLVWQHFTFLSVYLISTCKTHCSTQCCLLAECITNISFYIISHTSNSQNIM